jgi:hypothetical protein
VINATTIRMLDDGALTQPWPLVRYRSCSNASWANNRFREAITTPGLLVKPPTPPARFPHSCAHRMWMS